MKGWWALVLAAMLGCSDGGGSGGDPGGEVVLDPCGFSDGLAASIDVSERFDLFHADVYSRIGATLRDRPDLALHAVVAEEGACRYLQATRDFCDPACDASESCTADEGCQPYPVLV